MKVRIMGDLRERYRQILVEVELFNKLGIPAHGRKIELLFIKEAYLMISGFEIEFDLE